MRFRKLDGLLSDHSERPGDRESSIELNKIELTSVLPFSPGCSGPNTLVASFSGPIEVRIRDERLDKATLEVSHRPLDGMAGQSSSSIIPL